MVAGSGIVAVTATDNGHKIDLSCRTSCVVDNPVSELSALNNAFPIQTNVRITHRIPALTVPPEKLNTPLEPPARPTINPSTGSLMLIEPPLIEYVDAAGPNSPTHRPLSGPRPLARRRCHYRSHFSRSAKRRHSSVFKGWRNPCGIGKILAAPFDLA